jgi:hypothetical protein
VARQVVKKPERSRVTVTPRRVEKLLGVHEVPEQQDRGARRDRPRDGLAWTTTGGEILSIESTIMPGKGKLIITGKLGDVMQESAHAAMSYVRSRADLLGLERDFYSKIDVHIHVPEGAMPKDGPSAGITIATSVVSALTRIPVRRDLAMTGEITLRGRVLPIGGLKEKALAAHRADLRAIVIPADNAKGRPRDPEVRRQGARDPRRRAHGRSPQARFGARGPRGLLLEAAQPRVHRAAGAGAGPRADGAALNGPLAGIGRGGPAVIGPGTFRRVAQLVERRSYTARVAGSSPVPSMLPRGAAA